ISSDRRTFVFTLPSDWGYLFYSLDDAGTNAAVVNVIVSRHEAIQTIVIYRPYTASNRRRLARALPPGSSLDQRAALPRRMTTAHPPWRPRAELCFASPGRTAQNVHEYHYK